VDDEQAGRVGEGRGFFAALDQSGGSTPKALAEYGVPESAYGSDEEMFDLVHRMRTRVVTDASFTGERILGAILFEQTMDREVEGLATAEYLWQRKHVVPFLKVDKGLADQADGVQLMKPIDTLDDLLDRARQHGVFGTKMRSVVKDADEAGVTAVVDQQVELAHRIADAGLVPILEPEVSIDSATKAEAEDLLHDRLAAAVAAWPHDVPLMLKLTIPSRPDLYADLAAAPPVLRVLALSGGYTRDEACARLAADHAMIASFSRALLEGLSAEQSDAEFGATLEHSIAEIYAASVDKSVER
jgi:fructose-bisphosphate aldolase, class I